MNTNTMSNTMSNNTRTLLASYRKVRLVGTVDAVGICESGKTICLKDVKIYSLDGTYSYDICVGEIDHIWLKGAAVNNNTIHNGVVTAIGHTGTYQKRSGLIQFGVKTICLYKGSEYKPPVASTSSNSKSKKGKGKRKHG